MTDDRGCSHSWRYRLLAIYTAVAVTASLLLEVLT